MKTIFLTKITRPTSLDILYVASPTRPLPSLFNLCPPGPKMVRHRGHMFYICLYRKIEKNVLV